jgi:hypothetical protein
MNDSLNIGQLIALLVPLVLVELGLLGFALYDLVKRKHVRGGNKLLWVIIIVVFEFFGPILYFVLGREEE